MNHTTNTCSARVSELLEQYGDLKGQKAVLLWRTCDNNSVEVRRLDDIIAKLGDELVQIVKHLESSAVNSAARPADKTRQIYSPSGKKCVLSAGKKCVLSAYR